MHIDFPLHVHIWIKYISKIKPITTVLENRINLENNIK